MKKLIFLLFLSFIATGCHRSSDNDATNSKDQLPAATQSGANTAGCVINGKVIIPKDGINGNTGYTLKGLEGYLGDNFYTPILGSDYFSFLINNYQDKGNSFWIYLQMNNIQNGAGEYIIGQGVADILTRTDHPYIFVRKTTNGISTTTYLSGDNSGKIIITKLTNSIISGTFSGNLYNMDNPTEKIQVTDGRFDIKIQ